MSKKTPPEEKDTTPTDLPPPSSVADFGDPGTPAEPLRDDGPTLEEFMRHGYRADDYPPRGYAARESPAWARYRNGEPVLAPGIDAGRNAAHALVTSRSAGGFNRAGYRFTRAPTLVSRAVVGEERWHAILEEGNRFLIVSFIDDAAAEEWAGRNTAPTELDLAKAKIASLEEELESARKEIGLARTVGRRRGPERR